MVNTKTKYGDFIKPVNTNETNKRSREEVELSEDEIVGEPALRKPINDYSVNIGEEVRRLYITKGACQPKGQIFPSTKICGHMRKFHEMWFGDFDWLEYSASKDAAFCLWCYLFPTGNKHGDDVFINHGFRNWKKACESFRDHEGGSNSRHNHARVQVELFKDQRHNVNNMWSQHTKQDEIDYRIWLTAVVDVIRFLLKQGLAFCGHDESTTSNNRGNFLELVKWYCEHNDEVNKVLNLKVPGNHQLTSPKIQKEIVNACATEVRNIIVNEVKGKFFSILIDESRDCSIKEQMAMVFRYVDDGGEVIERFVGVVHVTDTCASSLKSAIDNFFAKHGLTMSRVRGQGYDGASNMRGELNGLKQKILDENKYAFYIHCFAHQLQKDSIRQKQYDDFVKRIEMGEVCTGKGKNLEMSLVRAGDTRWGSHLKTIHRILDLWKPVKEVLIALSREGPDRKTKGTALSMAEKMENFEFVFIAHLMLNLLRKTNDLSQALQLKNQNICSAIRLIKDTKYDIKKYRDDGWQVLIKEVTIFCAQNEIHMPNMENVIPGRVRRTIDDEPQTYLHRFRVDIFYQVVDLLLNEMNERFTKSNSELLTCIACLDPRDSFQSLDREKLLRLAELYSEDFTQFDLGQLKIQLDRYISNIRSNEAFSGLQDIGQLAKKMVHMKYHITYALVYRLLELALVLPVATVTVERSFSAMKFIKMDLQNKMGDMFLTDALVCYVEKDIFDSVEIEAILQRFQNMGPRRLQLPAVKKNNWCML
ncbi:zinc finger MYM-type protein 1-like [Helianthus annuus]|uniref:zinc finger MYM-type protein 1-like n=1 Tax=Helianthus annuus TaxID=4232 RepID=UPI000B8F8DB3|nr:zinc finger MYM-type protein 1-like [Helianthus annuus]